MIQLVLFDDEHQARHPFADGEHLVGSGPDCAVRIPHPTVSRRHAVVRVRDGSVEIEDAGSRNGTRVDGLKVNGPRRIEIGSRIQFGTVEARLEEVDEDDLELGVAFPGDEAPPPSSPDTEPEGTLSPTTLAVGALHAFTNVALPRLLEELERRESPGHLARAVGAALLESLPCLSVEIRNGENLLFRGDAEVEARSPAAVEAAHREFIVAAEFPHAAQARGFFPLLDIAARLVALAEPDGDDEPRTPSDRLPARPPDPPTVVEGVRRLYREAERVADGDIGVLIVGESGTGKEVLARFLHAASPRRDRCFVALNCAALPRDLLEAELFGVEKGVATGVEPRPGKFEQADGGTLLLDEIGDMAPETQAKILRVLQEGEVYRLGGSTPRPARPRVLAATNRDIGAMRESGEFRNDLYHRIADWVVELPPLRGRKADIPNLAAHFLAEEAAARGVRLAGISKAAVEALTAFRWPGNIRQLQREMARVALFLEDGDSLQKSHLQAAILESEPEPGAGSLQESLDAAEKRAIGRALRLHDGDVPGAAESLGVGRSTLYRRMKELGLTAAD